MTDKDGPGPDPLGEDARLRSLDERLKTARTAEAQRTGAASRVKKDDGTNLGNRVLAELIGGMVGGALIGWVLDRLLGTAPWLLLVMFALGVIVAFRNIIRISTRRPE